MLLKQYILNSFNGNIDHNYHYLLYLNLFAKLLFEMGNWMLGLEVRQGLDEGEGRVRNPLYLRLYEDWSELERRGGSPLALVAVVLPLG